MYVDGIHAITDLSYLSCLDADMQFVSMFAGASEEAVSGTDFTTWSVKPTNLQSMFQSSKIKILDISGWNVESVIDMSYFLDGAKNLTTFISRNLDFKSLFSITNMFASTYSFTTWYFEEALFYHPPFSLDLWKDSAYKGQIPSGFPYDLASLPEVKD